MKRFGVWFVVALLVAGAAGGGYWFGHHRGAAAAGGGDDPSADPAKDEKPVATVGTVPVRMATISETITAYGTVIAPQNEVRVVSVPFEARVTKTLVTPGQTVTAGQPLLEVEGSAATSLMLEEARTGASAAERDLQLVQQRFDQKLATNSDLNTAQNALRLAKGRLQSLEQGGAGGARQLKSDAAGVVSKVDVQIGQVVPIGGPLVEVVAQNHIEVKLGAEPEDVASLKTGQSVQIHQLDDGADRPTEGKIRLIAQRVDPATRLVDVIVSLPPGANLLLEGFVTAEMTKTSAEALVVPREAVLPAEDGKYELFTVKDGHASKHVVQTGIENGREVQVIAGDLKAGDVAVMVGNFELEDGMAVQGQPASTQPATTEPAGSKEASATGSEK